MLLRVEQARLEAKAEEDKRAAQTQSSSKRLGEGEIRLNPHLLDKSLRDEKKRKAADEPMDRFGDKRRKYDDAGDVDVTEEDLGKHFLTLTVILLNYILQRHTE